MYNSKIHFQPNVHLFSEISTPQQLKAFAKYNRKLIRLSFTNIGPLMDPQKLFSLRMLIKKQKHLSSIKVSIDEICMMRTYTFVHLLGAIGTKPHLKTLDIKTSYENLDNFKIFQAISRLTKKLSNMKTLHLSLPHLESSPILISLLASLTHLKLKDLELELLLQKQHPIAANIGVKIISKLLEKMPSLQNLRLDILEKFVSPEEAISCLSESFQNLVNLKRLSLGFDEDMELSAFLPIFPNLKFLEIRSLGHKITGIGFLNLAESLEKLSNLRSLSVDIDGIEKATEPTAENVAQSLTQLQSLRELNLTIHKSSNSNNNKVKRFLEFLPSLRLLKKMKLNLFKTPSSKNAINNLNQSLKGQKSLEELTLLLEECNLSDLELSGIADGISYQKNLKKIEISLKDNKGIVNPGIIELFKSIRDLSSLKSLYLDLSGISHLNDQSLRGVLDILARITALQNIGLLLSECKNLTDDWLIRFAEGLKGQRELIGLVLNLTKCSMISDKGFVRLTKCLASCKGLQQLGFGIEKCQISGKGIQNLRELLEELKKIRYLQLKLSGFMKVSYQDMIEIGNVLKKMKFLQRVGMDTYPFSVSKDEPPVYIEDCSNQVGLWGLL